MVGVCTTDPMVDLRKVARGYISCRLERDYYGTFSFDRIKHMAMTEEHFVMDEDFDAHEYFSECFGIVHGDGTPCMKIVIRAYGVERFYLRDLPMHHSQKEIATAADYSDFELTMRPSIDFSAYLLGRGADVQVLEPDWLVDEIQQMHADALDLYI